MIKVEGGTWDYFPCVLANTHIHHTNITHTQVEKEREKKRKRKERRVRGGKFEELNHKAKRSHCCNTSKL